MDVSAEGKIILRHSRTVKGYSHGDFARDDKQLLLFRADSLVVENSSSSDREWQIDFPNLMILGARFSADGKVVAVASRTRESSKTNSFTVGFWDVRTKRQTHSLPTVEDLWYRNIDDLSMSLDGNVLASNLGGVPRLWQTGDGTELLRFPPPGDGWESGRVLMTPDGRNLAVNFRRGNPSSELVRVWNLLNNEFRDLATNVYRDWEFSQDSKYLAVTAIQEKGHPTEHSAIEIWNLETATKVRIIEVPKEWRGAYVVSFSPGGEHIAIGGYKRFGIFEMKSGNLLADNRHADRSFFRETETPNELTDVQFSPDGKTLFTGGGDNTVKLWKIEQK